MDLEIVLGIAAVVLVIVAPLQIGVTVYQYLKLKKELRKEKKV